jgi:hypothetical protein
MLRGVQNVWELHATCKQIALDMGRGPPGGRLWPLAGSPHSAVQCGPASDLQANNRDERP